MRSSCSTPLLTRSTTWPRQNSRGGTLRLLLRRACAAKVCSEEPSGSRVRLRQTHFGQVSIAGVMSEPITSCRGTAPRLAVKAPASHARGCQKELPPPWLRQLQTPVRVSLPACRLQSFLTGQSTVQLPDARCAIMPAQIHQQTVYIGCTKIAAADLGVDTHSAVYCAAYLLAGGSPFEAASNGRSADAGAQSAASAARPAPAATCCSASCECQRPQVDDICGRLTASVAGHMQLQESICSRWWRHCCKFGNDQRTV